MNKDRDNLVFLLADMKAQLHASTKSAEWEDVYARTKLKVRRLYEKNERERYANLKRRHVRVSNLPSENCAI